MSFLQFLALTYGIKLVFSKVEPNKNSVTFKDVVVFFMVYIIVMFVAYQSLKYGITPVLDFIRTI